MKNKVFYSTYLIFQLIMLRSGIITIISLIIACKNNLEVNTQINSRTIKNHVVSIYIFFINSTTFTIFKKMLGNAI